MNDKHGKNMAASVRDRLLALARERGEDFQLLLTQYGLERLLYRLSQSGYQDRFILKGAMLFVLWGDQPHRPTRDVDFLAFGDSSEAGLQAIFRELCSVTVEDDGLTLMADNVQVEVIRDETEYGGIRVRLFGDLAGARIPIQADIGFGDAVTPEAHEIEYPTLLGNPAPYLRAYPRETVVAEKYQALVNLGIANSRMKDFYDLWVIARKFDFNGETLSAAIHNTFSRRPTPLPEHTPSGLSTEFHEDAQKNNQWNAFLRRNAFAANAPSLTEVCSLLDKFLLPPTKAGFLFLAVVLDAFSRRVVGWAMATHLRTELVLDALNMALWQRRPSEVIHHSDQGCQYTSIAFGRRCREAGVRPSTGSVGDCYDNAMCESFFATLECELIDRHSFRTQAEARLAVFDFIEGWYNPHRRHSAIDYHSPIDFERRYQSPFRDESTNLST